MSGQVFPTSSAEFWTNSSARRPSFLDFPVSLFFVAADLLGIAISVFVIHFSALWIFTPIFGAEVFADPFTTPNNIETLKFSGLLIALLWFGGLYNARSWEIDEIAKIFIAIGLTVSVAALMQPALGFAEKPLVGVVVWTAFVGVVISLRMALRALPLMRSAMSAPLIMVGHGMSTAELGAQFRESRSFRSNFLGQYGCREFLQLLSASPSVGVAGVAETHGHAPREITFVVVPSPEEMVDVTEILEGLSDANVGYLVAVPFFGLARRTVTLRKVMGGDVVFADVPLRRSTGLALVVKRWMDVVISLIALLLLSPILLTIAALLRFERGPVFFKQMRVGKNRARFGCFKFRTMVPDAEARLRHHLDTNPEAHAEWAEKQKLTNDPRITMTGRFLRKSSLDELPQLINVLRGEMSLVGPRPIVAPEVDGYDSDHAYYYSEEFEDYARMRPGITGLWQVSGRASTTHDERIRLDRWYARNWSIWLDIVIILKTIRAAALGTGSS